MAAIVTLLVLFGSCLSMTHGMDCYLGDDTIMKKLTQSCPRLLDSSENAYCCADPQHPGEFYCCNLWEFAATYLIIGVVAFVVLSIIFSIVCCLCCPCCFIYKRRHGSAIF